MVFGAPSGYVAPGWGRARPAATEGHNGQESTDHRRRAGWRLTTVTGPPPSWWWSSAPVVVVGLVVVGGSVLVVVASVVVVVGAAVVVGAVVGARLWWSGRPLGAGYWWRQGRGRLAGHGRASRGRRLSADRSSRGGRPTEGPRPGVGVVVVRLGAVVGAGLRAGSIGTAGDRARADARFGGDGWGSRVAEATAARTPVVSPKATSMSRQDHRELVRCRGGDGRCRGGGVDMGMSRFDGNVKADMAHFLGALPGRIPLRRWPCSPRAASSTGRT